jgi:hypothetical protein
MLITA